MLGSVGTARPSRHTTISPISPILAFPGVFGLGEAEAAEVVSREERVSRLAKARRCL
jgi:hypothetical protein